MSIAPTFERYLASQNITYDVITHEPAMSSSRTAETCRISGDRIAKAVVLRDTNGFVLAILPASHHIRLSDLETRLGFDVDLATEQEIEQLFEDCERGAVPPAGECYGLDVIVDDSIEEQPDVYLEAGDHATLIHLTHAQFARFTEKAWRGRFSVHD
ncbi:MAG: YbaK/EbsC family protein [Beijerinckiaceae bacterium]|nr:YbaK/EbsC family protein [Beijerinckiaceae bacterium]